jgi:hypothetical protein
VITDPTMALTPANPRTDFPLSKFTVPAVYQSRSLENNENGLQMVPSQALMFVVLAVGLSAPLKRACRQKRSSGVRKGVRSINWVVSEGYLEIISHLIQFIFLTCGVQFVAFSLDFELPRMPISVPSGLGPNAPGLPGRIVTLFAIHPPAVDAPQS